MIAKLAGGKVVHGRMSEGIKRKHHILNISLVKNAKV
jgi:hypothetical protein